MTLPSVQRGSVVKRGKTWQARWREPDPNDRTRKRQRQRAQGGFATKSAAWAYLDDRAKEVLALRRGDLLPAGHRPQTITALLDTFLERHGSTVDRATKRKLERQLRHARAAFGDRHPDSLNRLELEDWRQTLSRGSRHDVFRALRQALAWAAARSLCTRDATAGIRNPKRKRHERRTIVPFESWQEVESVADELDARYRAIPVFAVATGLRPEEWIALERADVDRESGVVNVRRRYSGGELKDGGKTAGSVRAVPLRQRVLDALDAMPKRIDTRLLFPAPRCGYIDLERFRDREWAPALRAAELDPRGPYTMRHTFATWAIEDGRIPLAHLATIMGTSIRELEDTYHRWLRRTDDQLRAAFDAYDTKEATG